MCGRYFLDVDFYELYQKIILHESEPRVVYRTGDVLPTDRVPVILAPEGQGVLRAMRWGLSGYAKGQRLINARRETLLQKSRFERLMEGQRCIVPASAFYEWEKQGRRRLRHTFAAEGCSPWRASTKPPAGRRPSPSLPCPQRGLWPASMTGCPSPSARRPSWPG